MTAHKDRRTHARRSIGIIAILAVALFSATWLTSDSSSSSVTAARPGPLSPNNGTDGSGGGDTGPTGQRSTLPAVTPVVRDMADVIADTTGDPNSKFNRWLRDEYEGGPGQTIRPESELDALREAALGIPPDSSAQVIAGGGASAAVLGPGFAAMDYNDGGGSVPPDPEIAAGPDHVILTVNVAVAIYDKTGTPLVGPTAAGNLFSNAPCTGGLFDPNVIFDEEEGRYFLAYDQGGGSASGGYCVLVSQTDDPTGVWYEYFFPLNSGSGWMDYPHAGVGDTHIFMGGNIFSLIGGFVEGRIYAFDKSDLYAGAPVSVVQQGLGPIDTPQPLHLHGQSDGTWPSYGDTHYFLGEVYDGQNYPLLRWDTTTLTNLGNIDLGAAAFPVSAQQLGGNSIQTNDWRPQDFEYRNGYGWTTTTISCNPGGGTITCVRWAQIDIAGVGLGPAGVGTFASNGEYRYFADIAVNRCNDAAVGYTKSSTTEYPGVYIAGRDATDGAGLLQPESLAKAGELTYTAFDSPPHRWGDYSAMTIDPDGLTLWYAGEYSGVTGNANGTWATWINSLQFDDCGSEILCNALPVTVDLNQGDVPTAGDDVILGTPNDDVINAGDGNDTVCAGDGEDFVVGGAGDDDIFGEGGNDEMSGNAGADLLDGGEGADTAFGGSGDDEVLGAGGDDLLLGGGSGSDRVEGGPGNDRITGGSDGDQRVDGGVGADTVVGGGGNDALVFGGDGDDRVSGNGGKDVLFGEGGDDELFGGPNDDELYGGDGDDFLGGNDGVDICDGGPQVTADVAAGNCETLIDIP